MERGSCDISNKISIFCQVHSCKQIRNSSYGSNVAIHFVAGNRRWLWPRRRELKSFWCLENEVSVSWLQILTTGTQKDFNFTQHCQVLTFQIPRNWDCGWQCVSSVALLGRPLRALSATVPVSRNLEIKHLTVLCEIGSLSGCRLLKSAAMTRKLRSPDIKTTSILSSVVNAILRYLQQNVL